MSEGVGVFITYFFVWLSQGQQYETGICLALNWIGLQLESFVLKYVKPNLTETGYNTLCGTFCGLNFLLFVLFNSIAVVGLSTAQVFSVKLLQQGKIRIQTVKLEIPRKSRIPNFCYIQVIVFDLGYLPVAAVGT